ncbi:hypothetical protein ACNKHT_22425 [Shigella flexneri]
MRTRNPPVNADDPSKSLASMGINVFDADYRMNCWKKTIVMRTPATTLARFDSQMTRAGRPRHRPALSRQSDPHAEPYWRDVGTLEAYWKANLDRPLWCRNWICTIAIGQFAPTMNHYRQRNSCRIAPVATDDP